MAIYYIQKEGVEAYHSNFDAVIVAPSLYWYRHAQLPTRSLTKASRMADHLLSKRPPNYQSLFVQRAGDGYDCFAYDAQIIASLSQTHQIPSDLPHYFLQQLVETLPLRIDENRIAESFHTVAIEKKDTLTKVKTFQDLDLSLPRKEIKPFNNSQKKRLLAPLGLLVGLTLLAWLLHLGLSIQSLNAYDQALQSLQKDRSFYQIIALTKRYEKMEKEQTRFKKVIAQSMVPPLKMLRCTPKKGCVHE